MTFNAALIISRREMCRIKATQYISTKESSMKRILSALLLALLAAGMIFAGGSQEAEAASSAAVSSGDGKYVVDTLRIGVASLPTSMDPTLNVGNATIRVHFNIFDTLIYADQDDSYALKPMLAESWERIDDYTLELKLRDDVYWHNGDKFTSKDVQFTFDRLKKNIPGNTLAQSLMNTIDHVEIIDDYTCRIVTSVVDPLLEIRIASSWGAWILPADYITEVGDDEFALHPVGTGPFMVESFSPEKVVMKRAENYWGEKPYVNTIEYINYPEASSRITALMTGEVDIITQLPLDQVPVVENAKGVNAVSLPISNIHVIEFYFDGEDPSNPVNDKKLRQALSLAVDRQMLSDAFWGGKAEVPRGHQYPDFGDMYFADYPVEEYNLEKARQLLAESNYSGQEITYELRNGYYTFGNEVAEAVTDMWRDLGVNCRVVFKDSEDDDTIVRNWSNSMRFPDPAGGLWLLWGNLEEWRWGHKPQAFLDAGNVLTTSLDKEERKAAARELMDIFREEVPAILLYYPVECWGVRDGLEWHPYASQTLNFRADAFWGTEA